MIAVICLDLVLQTAETVDAMARAAKLATRTNAVIKLARAFRFAMDEAGVLVRGHVHRRVHGGGRGAGGVGGELGQQVMQTLHTVI